MENLVVGGSLKKKKKKTVDYTSTQKHQTHEMMSGTEIGAYTVSQ